MQKQFSDCISLKGGKIDQDKDWQQHEGIAEDIRESVQELYHVPFMQIHGFVLRYRILSRGLLHSSNRVMVQCPSNCQ